MKRQMSQILGIRTPADGFTNDEKQIVDQLVNMSVSNIYAKLPTARMKAIVALHFELGYDQSCVADIFEVSQSQISQEIETIRKVLSGGKYRPHRQSRTIKPAFLLKMLMQMVSA